MRCIILQKDWDLKKLLWLSDIVDDTYRIVSYGIVSYRTVTYRNWRAWQRRKSNTSTIILYATFVRVSPNCNPHTWEKISVIGVHENHSFHVWANKTVVKAPKTGAEIPASSCCLRCRLLPNEGSRSLPRIQLRFYALFTFFQQMLKWLTFEHFPKTLFIEINSLAVRLNALYSKMWMAKRTN